MSEKVVAPRVDIVPLRDAFGKQAFRADLFAGGRHVGTAYGATSAMARANALALWRKM